MKRLAIAVLLTAAVEAQVVTNPPLAARISADSVSLFESSIVGAAGSVTPLAYVACVTLETGHFTIVKADSLGAFRASLFAPAGTTVMIKADPTGSLLKPIFDLTRGLDHQLMPLAGTIIRVPDPPSTNGEIVFGTAARERVADGSISWSAQGSISQSSIQPGQTLTIRATLTTPNAAAANPRVRAQFGITPLSRPDGRGALAQNTYVSTFMTPTGLPIERNQALFTNLQSGAESALTVGAGNTLSASLETSLTIPSDVPHGYYRLAMHARLTDVVPASNQQVADFRDLPQRAGPDAFLPVIRIGNPAPPRVSWALLVNDVIHGMRGVTSVEDRDRVAMSPRVALPSDRLIVPLDRTYNLEPFAPTLIAGDRGGPPAAPLIPLRFPSGEVRVTIEAPDGSSTTLGPLPIVQALLIGPENTEGGGTLTDPCRLTTNDPRFNIRFSREGLHRIVAEGFVEDVQGNRWTSRGTFLIDVAKRLAIDPFIVPGTPFEVGDTLPVGLVSFPPLPAIVQARVRFAPQSDAGKMIERYYNGRLSRFGYGRLGAFTFDQPGEYRVDLSASTVDETGRRWSGVLTWGGVVGSGDTRLAARGRRGIDNQPDNRQIWFFRTQTGLEMGPGHIHIPLHSGDVMWMEEKDAATPTITFQDTAGDVVPILNEYCCAGADPERVQAGEIPLITANIRGLDVHLSDRKPDIVGYSYKYIERPLVRVREIIGADVIGTYWRFNDRYGFQQGTGANGDLPNDFKFQFGGVLLGGTRIDPPRYAIYGSLFVLLPEPDTGGGSRIFPPFQGNGGGPSGGPIMKLKGLDVDLFLHLTAVRPGSILQRGETATFAGNVAPPLAARVEIVVTSPAGIIRTIAGRANAVGAFSIPSSDFTLDETGVWTANVKVVFDGVTSAGKVTEPFPTGGVLGSRGGTFHFYVVDPAAVPLGLQPLPERVRPADGPIDFAVQPPSGWSDLQLSYTTTMPGFVLEEGSQAAMTYRYDAPQLGVHFPNLDQHDSDGHAAADTVVISLMLSGNDSTGQRRYLARRVVLQGEQVQLSEQRVLPPPGKRRSARQ